MTFKNDIGFSKSMEKWADFIYEGVLPIKKIERLTRDGQTAHILDKDFHIDCILTLENNRILTLQEKFLRDTFAFYDCWTQEYHQNRHTGEKGEYFKLCTDLYFTGYGNEKDGFVSAYLFKVIDVKMNEDEMVKTLKPTKGSNADFFAYPFKNFNDSWFIYKKVLET